MHQPSAAHISQLSLHMVGNKHHDEPLIISDQPLAVDEKTRQALSVYFGLHKEPEEYYQFEHASALTLNEVYTYVSHIFEHPDSLHEQSMHIAEHLFKCSTHPNIKGGELYVAYLKDCRVEGFTCDAIGIFKSEHRDTFLKISQRHGQPGVSSEEGIDINKLDKGCIVYNIEADDGYVVTVKDNTNKGAEAQYWKEDFLQLKARSDNYHQTQHMVAMCQDFIKRELPERFKVSKADQADLLNRSAQFFKEEEQFDLNTFSHSVMGAPEVIDDFTAYKEEYERERQVTVGDGFDISAPAVKRQSRGFKSVLKLDKNFHIYIHGNREMIERGVDEFGRKFYKIYFEEER